jgi:hypothetical protein
MLALVLYDGGTSMRSWRVDVRIGIIQSTKELDVEVGDDVTREQVLADIEAALADPGGVLWLTDRRGRRVGVPTAKVAYVEVGGTAEDRRVGFGAP